MMTKRVRLRAGSHDQNVSRVLTPLKSPIKEDAIDHPPQAQRHCDQNKRGEHDSARDVFCVQKVERTGKQQTRSKADLNAESLLMQKTAHARGRVEIQSPAGHEQSCGKDADQREQYPH